jgi:uncharacterized membrane protein YfcA
MDYETWVLVVGLAGVIGGLLGLLGSGGSIITLPVLVYLARVPVHTAVGMSLLVVGGTSAVGGSLNAWRGNVRWKAAILFALSGLVGAFYGAKFTRLVPAPVLLLMFGGLMLAVGIRMLRGEEVTGQPKPCRVWACLGVGTTVGLLTGFLGVGGGFLVLPALIYFAGLEMRTAVGTSLVIITVNSAGGLLGQMRHLQLDWPLTLAFLGAAAVGMAGGNRLGGQVSARSLRRGFAGCVLALGAGLMGWNAWALLR